MKPSRLARAFVRILGTLGEVCISCKVGAHCNGCSCCMQRP